MPKKGIIKKSWFAWAFVSRTAGKLVVDYDGEPFWCLNRQTARLYVKRGMVEDARVVRCAVTVTADLNSKG